MQTKSHECVGTDTKPGAGGSVCDKKCNHTLHRIISPKTAACNTAATSTIVSQQHVHHHHPSSSLSGSVVSYSAGAHGHNMHKGATAARMATSAVGNAEIATNSRTGRRNSSSNLLLTSSSTCSSQGSGSGLGATSGGGGGGGGGGSGKGGGGGGGSGGGDGDGGANSVGESTQTLGTTSGGQGSAAASTPLILNLSQLQGGGGLLILNSNPAGGGVGVASTSLTPLTLTSFVCSSQSSVSASAEMNSTTQREIKQEPLTLSDAAAASSSSSSSSPSKLDGSVSVSSSGLIMTSGYESMMTNDDGPLKLESVGRAPSYSDLCDTVCKNDTVGMFDNDILDLSQEDIQKTLSANLPSCSTSRISMKALRRLDMDPNDLNPMDFIDNDISTPDDDVFANLDAFDMLTDFPDLDTLNAGDISSTSHLSGLNSTSNNPNYCGGRIGVQSGPLACRMDYREGTANITDFSPEWSYPDVR